MTSPRPAASWVEALSLLDEALAELAALRRQVARLTTERDEWRAKSGF